MDKTEGTDHFTDEDTNVWNNGEIVEEIRVSVQKESKFIVTIPKDIVLDGETGKADYKVKAVGDIAGDQKLSVTPDPDFVLSEAGGKADVTATVTQSDAEYVYTDLQGEGTEYDGVVQAQLTAGEWSGRFNFNINFEGEGSVSIPEVGQPLEAYSWAEIATISEAGLAEDYFNVGDEKTITLNSTSTTGVNTLADEGETYTLQIIGFNHDDLANSSGKAGITFWFKEVIGDYVMNLSATNIGGWEVSEMRTYINNDIYKLLPIDLRTEIKTVNKISDAGNYDETTLITTKDKLFLLSMDELGVSDNRNVTGQGVKYDIFTANKGCFKYYLDNTYAWWWLRSSVTNTNFVFFHSGDGSPYSNHNASDVMGIAPCFCI